MAAIDEGAEAAADLDYAVEIERFAAAWFDAGLPVPPDYAASDAQPVSQESRRYQAVRGRGDGRRVPGIIPTSRRSELAAVDSETHGTHAHMRDGGVERHTALLPHSAIHHWEGAQTRT